MSRSNKLAALVGLSKITIATAALAQCPESTLPCAPFTTTQAAYQLSCPNPQGTYGGYDLLFDLIAGTFSCGASGYLHPGSGSFIARDRFTLGGIAVGTPATIVAKLHVVGGGPAGCGPLSSFPSGGVSASLTAGASSQQISASPNYVFNGSNVCTTGGALDADVLLPIPVVAGQPFDLAVELSANAIYGTASIQGTLTFDGLPAGSSITSCQGFAQGAPVATRVTSWGRLKAIYR